MRPLALLTLAVVLPACASGLEREFESGAVTPYAQTALDAPPAAEPGGPSIDHEVAEVRRVLEARAAAWKERTRGPVVDPASLGFDLPAAPDDAALAGTISADLAMAAAYARSPAIRAAREQLRATVEQFDQVAFLDAILRQYTAFTRDLDLRIGAPRQKESMERFFPFPGAMALKSRIVEEDARAAEQRLARTVRTTIVAMGDAYYEYAYFHEAVRIVEENVELLKGVAEIARARYGVGKAQQAAVLKTHVEISSLEDRLVTIRERLSTVRARMNAILGRAGDAAIGFPVFPESVAPPGSPGALYGPAREHRQELVALRAKIRRTEALIELAETKAYPDLSLGLSRFEDGTATRAGGARMVKSFPDASRPMPRFWFGQTASFVQEMRRRLEAMRRTLEDLEARVGYEVKHAWFRWDAARRRDRLYAGSLLPQSKQAYEVLEAGFQEGVTDYLDALDAQRTWLRLRLESRKAVEGTQRGRLALLNALGTRLPAGPDEDR